MQLNKQLSAVQCFNQILAEDGAKSLFRSYKVTVAMNVPFAATLVTVNENLKVLWKPTESSYTFSIYFACAWLAGTIAAVITNPLDVTKTRL